MGQDGVEKLANFETDIASEKWLKYLYALVKIHDHGIILLEKEC